LEIGELFDTVGSPREQRGQSGRAGSRDIEN
jgi:hypothetical protein